MYSINLVVLFVLITVSMIRVNPTLTLYVLAPLPLLSLSIYYVSAVMNRKSEAVQEQQSRLSTFVQEAFSGIRILKAFSKEEEFTRRFAQEGHDYLDLNMGLVRVNALFYPLMLLLVGVSTVLTIYVGGKEVMAGRATTGNIAEFILYVNMLTWPVASLGWVTAIIQRAAASQQRINEFLHLEPEIVSESDQPVPLSGAIEFRNVSFTYPDTGIRALDHVSFHIPAGGSLAILGRTGSGKSTIAQLLLRMYDVTEGEILIDGHPIRSIPLQQLREIIGYVPQDGFLFSDTIANNIAFGTHGQPDEQRIRVAAIASAVDDNIREFPSGYGTMLGERGITLSGGQKQRVSIARALIREPRILVLDDCLSAVDTATEEQILKNLKAAGKDRTVVMISHRVSTLKNAERILLLENGAVAESGTHAELMAKRGGYFSFYERQLQEEAPDSTQ
jgi:ATP-binding cassette subfamily B protein